MIEDAKLDHVAIAVANLARAIPIYVEGFGGRFLFAGDNGRQGFRFAQFAFPNGGKIEFVVPLNNESFVARFLERRGEGVHHITLKTDDIHAALAGLRTAGLEPMMVNTANEQWKEAFIHPRDALGVLVQVAQASLSDEEMARHHLLDHGTADHHHLTFEELLSGR